MQTLYFDLETYSEVDLKIHSTHRYAAAAEVLLFAYAVGDGEPKVWDLTAGGPMPKDLANALWDPGVELVVQNSHFDRTVLRHAMGITLDTRRIYDTMIGAMAHSLPGALGKVGACLGIPVDEQKDKRGTELIRLFCKPRPKNSKLRRATSHTNPDEWDEFISYARQDIVAMRAIHRALPKWNYDRAGGEVRQREHALWCLDQDINDRGFATDVELAERALAAAAAAKADLAQRTVDATDGQVASATKRDQLLAYILEEYGVTLPDMTSDTLKRRMDDPELPEAVKLLISIRLEASMASSSKYKALVNAVSGDGRLRNTMQFAGAQRTTRWAGRVFQPQNMKRPDRDYSEENAGNVDHAITAVMAGILDLVTDEPMRALANVVRGCIVAPEGRKLCIADLANIEGRKLVWLAGEEWKLRAFAEFDAGNGEDMYKQAYARSFGVSPKSVDKAQRQIGKVQELGLGYEGGVGAFLTFAAVYKMDLGAMARAVFDSAPGDKLYDAGRYYDWQVKKRRSTFGLPREQWIACEVLKVLWREAHPEVVSLWADVAQAARDAINNPKTTFTVRRLKIQRDAGWLRIRLPSGRCLCYLQPRVSDGGEISYMGVNQYTRQWSRIKTYGGKLVENVTQASARDVMAHSMPLVQEAGYDLILSVHDELLTETPDTDEFSSDSLAAMMASNPPWAEGLPLAAAGFETYRYRKD